MKTNNKHQTAVDIAFEKLANQGLLITRDYKNLVAYREAKEMEKELMKGVYVEGSFAKMRYYDGLEYIDADQYYNETFGGGEQ
jgi:hypothetical protein